MKEIYRCVECGKYCEEDELIRSETTAEAYYGVSSSFDSYNSMTVYKCPHCHEDNLDKVCTYEVVDELNDWADNKDIIRVLKRQYKNIYDEIIKRGVR